MGSSPRVLICDDAAGFRLLTRTVLGDAGFDVGGAAADWDESIAMASEAKPEAIVLDLWLPTFERDQVERVRDAAPEALIAVFSSLSTDYARRMVGTIDVSGAVLSRRVPR